MLNSLIKKKTILDKSLIKLIKQQVDLIHQPEPQLYIKNIQIDNNLIYNQQKEYIIPPETYLSIGLTLIDPDYCNF